MSNATQKHVQVTPLPAPWVAIADEPPKAKQMVILIAVDAGPRGDYTTDPYCGWRHQEGDYARWPHDFPPTHWAPVPATTPR